MDVGAEHGQLEQSPRPAHRPVGGGRRVGGDRAEHRHAKVDRENEQEPGESDRREPLVPHGYEPTRAASTPKAASAAIARHAIGITRSGTRVASRPGTRRQTVS